MRNCGDALKQETQRLLGKFSIGTMVEYFAIVFASWVREKTRRT